MHPSVLAKRRGEAETRTQAAAQALATRFGLDAEQAAALAVYDRDPDTRQVMRLEAVADLLEGLVEKTGRQEDAQPAPIEREKPEAAKEPDFRGQSEPRRTGPGRDRQR